MLVLIVSLAFIIPGLMIVRKEQRKQKKQKEQNGNEDKGITAKLIIRFILVGIGVLLGGGFGGTIFLSLIFDNL